MMRFILSLLIVWMISSVNLQGPALSRFASAQEAGEKEDFVYDDHGKRDPFWPLVNSSGVIITYDKDILIADMVLEGIITERNGSDMAIINGVIVKINDTIGVFTVKTIRPDAVVLKKGQQTFTLNLLKED